MALIEDRRVVLKNGKPALIRCARPEDSAAVISYVAQMLAVSEGMITQAHEFSRDVEEERQMIQRSIDALGQLFLVAEVQGAICGNLFFSNGEKERRRHVGSFGVSIAAQYRQLGLGGQLLSTLLDWAEANPIIEKVALSVFANNYTAISLYEKFGFQIEGRRPRENKLSHGRYVDDIMMYKLVKPT